MQCPLAWVVGGSVEADSPCLLCLGKHEDFITNPKYERV